MTVNESEAGGFLWDTNSMTENDFMIVLSLKIPFLQASDGLYCLTWLEFDFVGIHRRN